MKPAGLKGREDMRELPLVTIDPLMRATMTMRSGRMRMTIRATRAGT